MIKQAIKTLEEISQTSSRNAKIALLAENDSKELCFLLTTAFDSYITMGIQDFDDGQMYRKDIPTLKELEVVRAQLSERAITGNAARELLRNTLLTQDSGIRNWLIKVFQKDLVIGIDRKTVNKVFPNLIPEFKIQKCDKFAQGDTFSGGRLIEPKYNGFRCFIVYDGKDRYAQSSNGRELYNINHILEESKLYIKKEAVLDGELGSDWNKTASVAKSSKTDKSNQKLFLHVFDYIPYSEWKERKGNLTLLQRKRILEMCIPAESTFIRKVPYSNVYSPEEAWNVAKEFKKKGFEGAVIKVPNSVYMFDRTKDWQKLKFVDTSDLRIIAVEEGTHSNVGRLGAFVCELSNGNMVNVGGGFTKKQRIDLWKVRNTLIGKVVEVYFQEKTKGEKSIQFPEVAKDEKGNIKFRPDKD